MENLIFVFFAKMQLFLPPLDHQQPIFHQHLDEMWFSSDSGTRPVRATNTRGGRPSTPGEGEISAPGFHNSEPTPEAGDSLLQSTRHPCTPSPGSLVWT